MGVDCQALKPDPSPGSKRNSRLSPSGSEEPLASKLAPSPVVGDALSAAVGGAFVSTVRDA
ncbi:hypothetical protein [Salinibacter phage 5_13]